MPVVKRELMDGKCVSFCNIISIFHTNGFPYLTVEVFTELINILCVFLTVKLELLCKNFFKGIFSVYKTPTRLLRRSSRSCVTTVVRQYKACIIRVVCVKRISFTRRIPHISFCHLYATLSSSDLAFHL